MSEPHPTETGSATPDAQPLVAPRELIAALPPTPPAAATVTRARAAIRDVLHGRDRRRLLVVVGPCSIHDPDAALEYAQRLARVAAATSDSLVIVMRTYLEKPRTALGWKGFVADPDLDGSCDVAAGLGRARALLLAINALGVPCGSELLDPLKPAFLADLLSWSGIGARTAESPVHRQLASGIGLPVGIKNGLDGAVDTAVNAMIAARAAHRFPTIDADGRSVLLTTRGNPDAHVVLRGGRSGPNYDPDAIARALEQVGEGGPRRPLLVDCSHGNSGKDPARQAIACRAVLAQVRRRNAAIAGLLLESHLEAGRQDWRAGEPLRRGVSITDACIGWDETEALLHEIAGAVTCGRPARVRPAREPAGESANCASAQGLNRGARGADDALTPWLLEVRPESDSPRS